MINEWLTAEGLENGYPILYRFRANVPHGVYPKHYPHLVIITWPYESETVDGMPGAIDSSFQNQMESALSILDHPSFGFLMMSNTGNGRKQWMWYVKNVKQWSIGMNQRLLTLPSLPISLENMKELNWQSYFEFLSIVQ